MTPQWQSGSVALRATQAEPAGQTASHACMDKREDGWNHQGDMKTGRWDGTAERMKEKNGRDVGCRWDGGHERGEEDDGAGSRAA